MRINRRVLIRLALGILTAVIALLQYRPPPVTQVPGRSPAVDVSVPATSSASARISGPYRVERTVDGDTYVVATAGGKATVRSLGIDTPETVDPRKQVQCFGKEASEKARELLTGKDVYLESDPTQGNTDRYGRLLRFVYLPDMTDIGLELIRQGYAHEYTYRGIPHAHADLYKTAESDARSGKVGLWNPAACP